MANASYEDLARLFVAWVRVLIVAKTIDRYNAEQIFSDAEREGRPSRVASISGIWDRVLPASPEPHPDEYVGSSAEVTGDYGGRILEDRTTNPWPPVHLLRQFGSDRGD